MTARAIARRLGVAVPTLLVVLVGAAGAAAAAAAPTVPAVTVGLGTAQTPAQVSSSVQILLALTVLSLAPAVLLLMTSFTRIVVVLSFARSALGTGQLPPNQILIGLALFLTLFVMGPTIQQIYTSAWQPYQAGTIDLTTALQRGEAPLQVFMLRQTRGADLTLFQDLDKHVQADAGSSTDTAAHPPASNLPAPAAAPAAPPAGPAAAVPLNILVPAFVVSELRTAFEMGFVLFVPFVIIDLVVGSTLMAMGMVMLPPMLISLPFKVLLFVLVDGWALLVQSLVLSFR